MMPNAHLVPPPTLPNASPLEGRTNAILAGLGYFLGWDPSKKSTKIASSEGNTLPECTLLGRPKWRGHHEMLSMVSTCEPNQAQKQVFFVRPDLKSQTYTHTVYLREP